MYVHKYELSAYHYLHNLRCWLNKCHNLCTDFSKLVTPYLRPICFIVLVPKRKITSKKDIYEFTFSHIFRWASFQLFSVFFKQILQIFNKSLSKSVWDSNTWTSDHKSPPVSTRPRLTTPYLPFLFTYPPYLPRYDLHLTTTSIHLAIELQPQFRHFSSSPSDLTNVVSYTNKQIASNYLQQPSDWLTDRSFIRCNEEAAIVSVHFVIGLHKASEMGSAKYILTNSGKC